MKIRQIKKAVAVGLSILMVAGLVGCGSSTEIDASQVFASVDDNKDVQVTMDLANFMARYSQAMYETYYMSYLGEDMWSQTATEDTTYEQSVKSNVADSIKEMLILKANMDQYGVEITEDDETAIAEAAKQFMEDNTDEDGNELISASEDVVKELLELYTIRTKMYDAMSADADTEVSDDEALQKAMGYIHFEDDSEDEGTQTAKEKADAFYKGLQEGKDFKEYAEECGYDPVETSFDADTTSPNEELITAVWALKKGEYTDIIETEDSGCYIAYLTSDFDKEATEAQKENIVEDRQDEAYQEKMETLKSETTVTINEDLLDDIDFENQGVTMYQSEDTDTEESAGTVSAE
jgi:foldase protein PrsA